MNARPFPSLNFLALLISPTIYLLEFIKMQSPTQKIFDSRELLIDSVCQYVLSRGSGITTVRSIANKNIFLAVVAAILTVVD